MSKNQEKLLIAALCGLVLTAAGAFTTHASPTAPAQTPTITNPAQS